MMKRHTSKLAYWLAGLYLVWSSLMFFGTLGGDGHDWWPITLFPLILPWSAIHQFVLEPLLQHWLVLDLMADPTSFYVTMDYIAGGYYIMIGTIWLWFVGKWLGALNEWMQRPSKRI